jgi:tryptophan-rich sensory protein
MKSIVTLALFILLILGGGTAIGLHTLPGEWYAGLSKPWFNPPNWLFGPAWSVLYVLIAIAGWRMWENHRMTGAMDVWWIGLGVNFMWSPVFFGMQSIGGALVVVVAMLALIIAFISLARPLDRIAAWLFVPYAAWVSFATLLNASIWWLN